MAQLSQHVVIRVGADDLRTLDLSIPAWTELSREPAHRGLLRHGVTRAIDHVGRELKTSYAEHARRYLQDSRDPGGTHPRALLAFGTRNTFQNLGLPAWHRHRSPRLLCRPDEPWNAWIYYGLCQLTDGRRMLTTLRFREKGAAETVPELAEPASFTASDIDWIVTGQPLLWDDIVPSLGILAARTYDLRHIWSLDWQDWQHNPRDAAIHGELMTAFRDTIAQPCEDRATVLTTIARKHALRTASDYLHSSLGMTAGGDLCIVMKNASLAELGEAHRSLGARRAILLDNGGSVGAGYWSRWRWEREGWNAIADQPVFVGTGSYFRQRAHAVFVAELAADLEERSLE